MSLPPVGTVLNVAGALVVVGFGFFVALAGVRTAAARAFALFAFGFGGAVGLRNVADVAVGTPATAALLYALGGAAWLVATVGVVWLGLAFPTPVRAREWRRLILPGLMLGSTLPVLAAPIRALTAAASDGRVVDAGFSAYVLGVIPGLNSMLAFALLVPLRSRDAAPAERSQLALLATALLPYVAYTAGSLAFDLGFGTLAIVDVGVVLVASGLWLNEAARGRSPRAARNLALLGPAVALYGMLERYLVDSSVATVGGASGSLGVSGLLRVFAVAVLAYAVVRHQLLGIDVKARWTISRSTVAAVFITAFFVASEAAQQFFGETIGSTYAGIAVAGMLVFAMTPLHRAAERLAERAVPAAPAPSSRLAADGPPERPRAGAASAAGADAQENAYRAAVRFALRDRRLTREEEAELHGLAEALGIRPARAHALLAEVERDAALARDHARR